MGIRSGGKLGEGGLEGRQRGGSQRRRENPLGVKELLYVTFLVTLKELFVQTTLFKRY
jgi:hypothetical protein